MYDEPKNNDKEINAAVPATPQPGDLISAIKPKKPIIINMDEDGWNLDNIKNPTKLIKGYAADIIAERKTQKVLKQMKDQELIRR